MTPANSKVSLVITQGDPRGVGLELLLRVAADGLIRADDRVFADPEALERRAQTLPAAWAEPGWAALRPCVRSSIW